MVDQNEDIKKNTEIVKLFYHGKGDLRHVLDW